LAGNGERKKKKKIKFGLLIPQQSLDFLTITKISRKCERLGFDSVWLVDHLLPYDTPRVSISVPMLESWTTLAALSRETSALKIGPLVTCNIFRRPQILAKMGATLDVISGGRLLFGIGACWFKTEFDQYGMRFPKINERIDRLKESIEIIKSMWTKDKTSFSGKYYSVNEAVCEPKPVQKPHPQFWIGAEGEKMLRVVAQYADVWNFASDINPYAVEEYKEKKELLDNLCKEYQRDPDEIEQSWLGIALVASSSSTDLEAKIEKYKPKSMALDRYSRGIVGTADDCIEKIKEYISAGVTYFTLIFPELGDEPDESLSIFGKEVIPAFD
jgi:F420-dependent oxidoreductase-like protein